MPELTGGTIQNIDALASLQFSNSAEQQNQALLFSYLDLRMAVQGRTPKQRITVIQSIAENPYGHFNQETLSLLGKGLRNEAQIKRVIQIFAHTIDPKTLLDLALADQNRGDQELAQAGFRFLLDQQDNLALNASFVKRVEFYLQESLGQGSPLNYLRYQGKNFLDEALNPMMILSFMAGGMAFRMTRFKTMKSLSRSPFPFLRHSNLARPISFATGFTAELGVFSGMNVLTLPRGVKIDEHGVIEILKHNLLSLSILKSAGAFGNYFTKQIHGVRKTYPFRFRDTYAFNQKMIPFTTGVLGLGLGHQAAGLVGLMPQETWSKSLVGALFMQTHMSLGYFMGDKVLSRFQTSYRRPFPEAELILMKNLGFENPWLSSWKTHGRKITSALYEKRIALLPSDEVLRELELHRASFEKKLEAKNRSGEAITSSDLREHASFGLGLYAARLKMLGTRIPDAEALLHLSLFAHWHPHDKIVQNEFDRALKSYAKSHIEKYGEYIAHTYHAAPLSEKRVAELNHLTALLEAISGVQIKAGRLYRLLDINLLRYEVENLKFRLEARKLIFTGQITRKEESRSRFLPLENRKTSSHQDQDQGRFKISLENVNGQNQLLLEEFELPSVMQGQKVMSHFVADLMLLARDLQAVTLQVKTRSPGSYAAAKMGFYWGSTEARKEMIDAFAEYLDAREIVYDRNDLEAIEGPWELAEAHLIQDGPSSAKRLVLKEYQIKDAADRSRVRKDEVLVGRLFFHDVYPYWDARIFLQAGHPSQERYLKYCKSIFDTYPNPRGELNVPTWPSAVIGIDIPWDQPNVAGVVEKFTSAFIEKEGLREAVANHFAKEIIWNVYRSKGLEHDQYIDFLAKTSFAEPRSVLIASRRIHYVSELDPMHQLSGTLFDFTFHALFRSQLRAGYHGPVRDLFRLIHQQPHLEALENFIREYSLGMHFAFRPGSSPEVSQELLLALDASALSDKAKRVIRMYLSSYDSVDDRYPGWGEVFRDPSYNYVWAIEVALTGRSLDELKEVKKVQYRPTQSKLLETLLYRLNAWAEKEARGEVSEGEMRIDIFSRALENAARSPIPMMRVDRLMKILMSENLNERIFEEAFPDRRTIDENMWDIDWSQAGALDEFAARIRGTHLTAYFKDPEIADLFAELYHVHGVEIATPADRKSRVDRFERLVANAEAIYGSVTPEFLMHLLESTHSEGAQLALAGIRNGETKLVLLSDGGFRYRYSYAADEVLPLAQYDYDTKEIAIRINPAYLRGADRYEYIAELVASITHEYEHHLHLPRIYDDISKTETEQIYASEMRAWLTHEIFLAKNGYPGGMKLINRLHGRDLLSQYHDIPHWDYFAMSLRNSLDLGYGRVPIRIYSRTDDNIE